MASQNPTSFTFNQTEGTFTFSNGHTTITAQTNIVSLPPSEPVTVESVTIEASHHTVILPITDFEVPVIPPPVEDLLQI
jgi:hypothetical protein